MAKVGILTLSDMGAVGQRKDTAGKVIREMIERKGFVVDQYDIIPDEAEIIAAKLMDWADNLGLDLILTNGGTGFAERDVTPEATAKVIEKNVPGIPEAMRAAGLKKTPMAILSRGVAGIRKKTLIINLPGSERGAAESLEAIIEALPHALDVIAGNQGH